MSSRSRSRAMFAGVIGVLSEPALGYGGAYHYGSGMMYGGGIFGWLMMVFIVVLVVAVAIGLARLLFPGRHRIRADLPAPHKSALAILEERYARGEIDKDEFEERRKTLSR